MGNAPWAEQRLDVAKLLHITREALPHFRVRADDPDQTSLTAAAYFARCRRVLVAMEALYADGLGDVATVPLRPLFEGWLRGMWVLLAGHEAVETLQAVADEAADNYEWRSVNNDWTTEIKSKRRAPGARSLSRTVSELLVAAGDEGGSKVLDAFHIVYAPESGRSVHMGLEGVAGHVADEDVWRWPTETRADPDPTGAIVWGAVLVAVFAKHLFIRFGLPTDAIEGLSALSPRSLLGP